MTEDWVDAELERVHRVAERIAMDYYEVLERANDGAREKGGTLNKTTVRVRRRHNSLYIEWVRFYFYRRNDGKLGRGMQAIKKGRGSQKYPLPSLLKSNPDPEVQQAIEDAEGRFAVLREYARTLVELRAVLRRQVTQSESVADMESEFGMAGAGDWDLGLEEANDG